MKRTFAPSYAMRRRAWWNRVKDSGPAECLFFAFLILAAVRFVLRGW